MAVALSLWTSLQREEPVFLTAVTSRSDPKVQRWSEMAKPEGNYASRWAMYEDITAWLGERRWTDKVVAEFGDSNSALRAFLVGARYQQLRYPEYDIENLHSVRAHEFDLVILDQTLEHVADPERALREMYRVLKPGGVGIVTTPFLLPAHPGANYGDYYRWTPQGMETVLKRCGFEGRVAAWGNRKAAQALIENMYLRVDQARALGLNVSLSASEASCPVTVWAIASKPSPALPPSA